MYSRDSDQELGLSVHYTNRKPEVEYREINQTPNKNTYKIL